MERSPEVLSGPQAGLYLPSGHVSCSGPACLDSEGLEEALGKVWSPPEVALWALEVRAAAPGSQDCGDHSVPGRVCLGPRPWAGPGQCVDTG